MEKDRECLKGTGDFMTYMTDDDIVRINALIKKYVPTYSKSFKSREHQKFIKFYEDRA